MVSITLALAAVVIRLVWEITAITSAGGLAITILLILAILGIYALVVYLNIKPSVKKLLFSSWPVLVAIY